MVMAEIYDIGRRKDLAKRVQRQKKKARRVFLKAIKLML